MFGKLPTVILDNEKTGKFFFAGAIPYACYDFEARRSMIYDTEQDAIDAAIAAGVDRLQGVDCRFIVGE